MLLYACLTLVASGLSACQSTKKADREPLFVGNPTISGLRDGGLTLKALGAPVPTVKKLRFTVRARASGKVLGTSTDTLKAATDGCAQFLEETAYKVAQGRCSISSRREAVAVGGFLVLLEAAEIWSADCAGLAGGQGRREVADAQIVSGQLFPLKVGNKLSVHYTVRGSDSEQDAGFADYQETSQENYEVVERIPDFRAANGNSVGEVFRIKTTAVRSRGKTRSYEFLFSTALGWRVGYRTDLEATLIDWVQ